MAYSIIHVPKPVFESSSWTRVSQIIASIDPLTGPNTIPKIIQNGISIAMFKAPANVYLVIVVKIKNIARNIPLIATSNVLTVKICFQNKFSFLLSISNE